MKNALVPGALIIASLGLPLLSFSKKADSIRAKEIREKNKVWNASFNGRDSLQFYALFDSAAVFSSAGARLVGREDCKRLYRFLHRTRPDITWYNEATKIEVSSDGENAYETGSWTETWTEKGDSTKSKIRGKYWVMYIRRKDGNWYIQAAIFTPLTCEGSYCNK
jgi:ketosteroid isomerase-like protein